MRRPKRISLVARSLAGASIVAQSPHSTGRLLQSSGSQQDSRVSEAKRKGMMVVGFWI